MKKYKVLWRHAMYAITSPNLTIQDSIGDFLHSPHHQLRQYCSVDTLEIYHERLNGYYEIYKLATGVVVTRHTQYSQWVSYMDPPPDMEQTLASIDRIDLMHIILCSKATLPREIMVNLNFWDVLLSWPNQSLWKNFQRDYDGALIQMGSDEGYSQNGI